MRAPVSPPRPGTAPARAETVVALEAVRAAALVCQMVRRDFDARLAARKDDRSPVTVADLAAQVVVGLIIADAFPDDPLMAEEDARQLRSDPLIAEGVARAVAMVRPGLTAADLDVTLQRGRDTGGPDRRWWSLDPVDGTKGFLRNEQYAVALALVEDGRPEVAVLGCPNLPASDGRGTGCLFVAERDLGAWELPLDDSDATPRAIRVDGDPDLRRARYAESVEAAHSDQGVSTRIAAHLGIEGAPVRMDSQAKYAVVARGDASIYLRIPRDGYEENIWDHAAGMLVVEEAGGTVSDIDGCPLDLTTGRRMTANRGIVAAPAVIHHVVIGAVREILGD